uniref:Phytanoyl-CoA dioxygenase n=1 Tax=Calcidiscus leptoporus TaxID=127549 RepID=A0A7S0IRP7_9EUKA|mmetsp:Transcript_1812/g.4076  ORF Transcript_1812/g.4076 Transcript_1812/m.4076 type:complete len:244 (+) Transcript_1812:363-1094(+)
MLSCVRCSRGSSRGPFAPQGNQSEPQHWLSALALHPAIGMLMRALLGGEQPVLISTQVFCKESVKESAGSHSELNVEDVPWHQDGAAGSHSLALWLALDDIAADGSNGGLQVLPRLHVRGRLPTESSERACATTFDALRTVDIAQHLGTAISYDLRAGCAAVHGPHTPHRSAANTSSAPRRVLVLRYVALRALADQREPVWIYARSLEDEKRVDMAHARAESRHQIRSWNTAELIDRRAYLLD